MSQAMEEFHDGWIGLNKKCHGGSRQAGSRCAVGFGAFERALPCVEYVDEAIAVDITRVTGRGWRVEHGGDAVDVVPVHLAVAVDVADQGGRLGEPQAAAVEVNEQVLPLRGQE